MKRLVYVLLGLLVCLAIFVLPAAAEDAAEPEPTTQAQEEPTEPQKEAPAFSPYAAPDWNDYENYSDYMNAYDEWERSLYGRYYQWRSGLGEDRPMFDPAFRQFYLDDPEVYIENHLVFKKVKSYVWENKKRVKRTYAVILDYFDTQDACTTLYIPATLDGCPVSFYMQRDSAWTGGLSDSGYTNNTVKKLILEEGITGVGAFAFSNFTRLIAVRIPSTVTSIGIGAFRGCTALRKVFGCEGLQTVMSGAFAGCEKLRAFENMDKLRSFEGAAFANTGFKTLTLASTVWLGGGDEDYYAVWHVFGGCKKLKKVTFLPADEKGFLYIGNEAFRNCPALKTVVLPKQCGKIAIGDYAFQNCTALQSIKNTDRLSTIERRVFEGCSSFQSLILPAGLRNGAYDTFRGSSLKQLYIQSKNTKLFDGSYESYWLYEGDIDDTIGQNFLQELPKTCTVYVVSKDMKYAVKSNGFKGTVKIRVPVAAPKTVKATKQNGKATISWTKVKNCDGYRVWSYDAKTGKYTKLATVKAGVTSVTLKSNAKQFAVRAYINEGGDVSWSKLKVCSV